MMQFAVTSEGMKQIERKAFESGIPYLTMMENAGKSAAEEIINRFSDEKSVAVLCGKGNNAGDGFVVARLLKEAGFSVSLFLLSGSIILFQVYRRSSRRPCRHRTDSMHGSFCRRTPCFQAVL